MSLALELVYALSCPRLAAIQNQAVSRQTMLQ